jgi:hypothetical protein
MSDTIYIPFFYIIQHNTTKKYYAGSKYGNGADPKNFMIELGYTTSSNTILGIIEKESLAAFSIRKLKVFTSGDAVWAYETKFLRKVNAAKNTNFYNMHNNDNRPVSYGSSEFTQLMNDRYGVDNYASTDECKEKRILTSLSTWGTSHPSQSEKYKQKKRDSGGFQRQAEKVTKTTQAYWDKQSAETKSERTSKGLAKMNAHIECEHCGIKTNKGNIGRYHGDKCKHKVVDIRTDV